jgi:hypothetical protein
MRVLFSDSYFLWSLTLDGRTGRSANVERLTFGTSRDLEPSETADGLIAYSSASIANNVWSLRRLSVFRELQGRHAMSVCLPDRSGDRPASKVTVRGSAFSRIA